MGEVSTIAEKKWKTTTYLADGQACSLAHVELLVLGGIGRVFVLVVPVLHVVGGVFGEVAAAFPAAVGVHAHVCLEAYIRVATVIARVRGVVGMPGELRRGRVTIAWMGSGRGIVVAVSVIIQGAVGCRGRIGGMHAHVGLSRG